ncbi:MAG TPA: hypothetical protein VKE94_04700, partial [Gemmataceae bacterium]|nr:hypothetical protein [Gemmataceae bacterium]
TGTWLLLMRHGLWLLAATPALTAIAALVTVAFCIARERVLARTAEPESESLVILAGDLAK